MYKKKIRDITKMGQEKQNPRQKSNILERILGGIKAGIKYLEKVYMANIYLENQYHRTGFVADAEKRRDAKGRVYPGF